MRNQVYYAELGDVGRKPYVIVSNDQRNRRLDSVLAVRVTTTDKSNIPTAVKLGPEDPVVGFVLADDIVEIFDDEIVNGQYRGALCSQTIMALNDALAQALALP